jgi:pilus assembly protein CpaE
MTTPIRALALLTEGITESQVEAAVAPGEAIQLTSSVDPKQPGWRFPPPALVDVLLVACNEPTDEAMRLVSAASEQRASIPVVVLQLVPLEMDGLLERVFDAGADDIVTPPHSQEKLVEIVRKAIARKHGAGAEAALAPLIAVVGPKGGTGKTVVSCNLAAALAKSGARTVLVDLDLSFGDVALALRLMPERTLYELVRMGGSLDAEKIEGFLATHEASGARALLAPIRPDQGTAIGAEFLSNVFTILRATHDYVVVDTPAGFPTEVITAIDNSTNLVVVGMLDAFSLKDTKLGLETIRLMGYPDTRIRIVLNRADSRVGISRDDVVAILGRSPDVLIPSERDITRSVNDGTPIVLGQKRSGASRALRDLASLYLTKNLGDRANGKAPSRRRIFGRS